MLLRESQFEHATELFYEAAAVPELWPKALQAVADACGALGANLFPISPGRDRFVCSPGIRGAIEAFVGDGWLKTNPYMRRGMQLTAAGWKGLITSEDMLSPEESARDRYVNEHRIPSGLGPDIGMVLVTSGSDLALPFTMARAPTDSPFLRDEVAKMNRLMERLKPAGVLALRIGLSAAHRIADSLAAIGKNVVLLSPSGRVLRLPPMFERHIGDALNVRNGRLSSWENVANAQLAAAIRRAVHAAPAGERVANLVALPRRSGKRPLVAQLIPIAGAGQDVFMLARAALIVTDPDMRASQPFEALGAAFGLSRAEARLASRIAQGEELKDIAEAEGITLETARARLKAVFAKTETHRQAELALLVAGLTR